MKDFDPSLVPPEERTPLVEMLLRVIQNQQEEIAQLKDEINKLKGQKGRPKIKPSKIEKPRRTRDGHKRSKTGEPLGRRKVEREERIIEPAHVPAGSRFKGYKTYTVQHLTVQVTEISFRLKVYQTREGKFIRGELPPEFNTGHFSPEFIAHCLQLYHGGLMTQPSLLEYLTEQGASISSGQLHTILTERTAAFVEELEAVRQAGIEESPHLHVDDTGARHQGKNGVCTCLSGPLFTYFYSSDSKSRLNFVRLLRGHHRDCLLDEEALVYATEHGASESAVDKLDQFLEETDGKRFHSEKSWHRFLKRLGISGKKDVRLLTEGVVLSSAVAHGLPEEIPVMSDAAPQFQLWASHVLCWVHEERHYRKLVPISDQERRELERIREQIWELYEGLKHYPEDPADDIRRGLVQHFDSIFKRSGVSEALDELLKKTYSRKKGLLQILDIPNLPLHNNDCERDIREYVKRRKISGSTRSDTGRLVRDTFLSLKKTCLKLGVSFFGYVRDRVSQLAEIPALNEVLISLARAGP